MTEKDLENMILVELSRYGVAISVNSGTIKTDAGNYVKGFPAGFPDVLFLKNNGLVYFVEVKTGKNKTSEKQKKFLDKLEKMNFKCGVAHNVAEALNICEI